MFIISDFTRQTRSNTSTNDASKRSSPTVPTKKKSKYGKKSNKSNKKHTVDSSPELKQMSKKPKTQLELSTTASEQETSS